MKSSRSASYEALIMVLLVLFWGCVGLNRFGIGMIFPKIVPEFHMQLWQAGLLISGTSITWAFSSWIGGWLSDRYGRRPILLPAAAFSAVMTAAMGLTWSFLSMFIVRDLLGVGDGVGWSVGEAVVNEESAPERRGFNQALFTAGYTLIGVGVGALIITSLMIHVGWRWVFPIIGAVTALVTIALILVMREPTPSKARAKRDWRQAMGLLRDPSMAYLVIMGSAILAWLQLSVGFNVLYLTKVRHFTLPEAGSVMAVWGFAGTAGQILLPLLSDRIGRKPVVCGSAAVCAVGLIVYLTGGLDLAGMRLVLGISGFCGWGLLPLVIATCVSEIVDDDERGAALGMTNFFGVVVGTTIMPVVGGVVADHFGLAGALWLVVGCQAIVAVLILAIRETAPRVVARRGLHVAA